jgi:alanine racemase
VHVAVSSDDAIADLNSDARVHMLVDTGLHRTGAHPDAARALADRVRGTGAEIEAVSTMVAGADRGDWESVERELDLLRDLDLDVPKTHVGGSSVAIERPELAGDIARCGLAVLGYYPAERQWSCMPLEPSLQFFVTVLEVRRVPAGERVGYSGVRVDRATTVATLGAGVADGVPASFGPGAVVEISGEPCPLLCPPSLDHCYVDATELETVRRGDRTLVLGGGRERPTSVAQNARRLETIVDHLIVPLTRAARRSLV